MTSLDIQLPLSSTRASYDPERAKARYQMNSELIADHYEYQKFIGERREDGALKLKELKPEHKQYVSCYINGMKGVEIAEHFNVAAITVYRVLADPLALEMIGEFDENFKAEFRAMFPLVADAVREGLESDAVTTRLKSVDRWTKVCRFLDGGNEDGSERKSEVVSAARIKIVKMIEAAVKEPTVIEIEAEVVEVSG